MGLLNILNYDEETKMLFNELDVAGNTLSAIVKGYATGSGGLVSFGLYGAVMLSLNVQIINLNEIMNLIFLILGCLFTYLIIALCMKATADNAEILVHLLNILYRRIKKTSVILQLFKQKYQAWLLRND